MKFLALALILVITAFTASTPAHARGYVSVGIGCCGGGYYPYHYYDPYYGPYYGYPAYYAPPPTVVYAQPAPTTYVVQQPSAAPLVDPSPQYYDTAPAPAAAAVAPANPPSSTTFTDKKGRTCRKFETSIDGSPVNGTACLQPDGSWRSVGE